ncbi:hypothetical protein D3C84_829800 [compost metagenome]
MLLAFSLESFTQTQNQLRQRLAETLNRGFGFFFEFFEVVGNRGFGSGIAQRDAHCVDGRALALGQQRRFGLLHQLLVDAFASHVIPYFFALYYVACNYSVQGH